MGFSEVAEMLSNQDYNERKGVHNRFCSNFRTGYLRAQALAEGLEKNVPVDTIFDRSDPGQYGFETDLEDRDGLDKEVTQVL